MHGFPSAAAQLPLQRSPWRTLGRTCTPANSASRSSVAASTASHCSESLGLSASFTWWPMRCSRKKRTQELSHELGWEVPPMVLSMGKPNCPPWASGAAQGARCISAIALPNSNWSAPRPRGRYSITMYEPPFPSSPYAYTLGMRRVLVAYMACSPSASPANIVAALCRAVLTKNSVPSSAVYFPPEDQELPPIELLCLIT
mmetsp:Transcript_60151/g.141961  ORF Transcript_60151/g.141961 Transcript_60151/m.141961 type:complete len:201 (+) Transcript_60151:665-1267(+)